MDKINKKSIDEEDEEESIKKKKLKKKRKEEKERTKKMKKSVSPTKGKKKELELSPESKDKKSVFQEKLEEDKTEDIIAEHFIILMEMGKGSFGQIHLTFNKREDEIVAVKKVYYNAYLRNLKIKNLLLRL